MVLIFRTIPVKIGDHWLDFFEFFNLRDLFVGDWVEQGKLMSQEEITIRKVLPEDIEAFVENYIYAYQELSEYKYKSKGEIKDYFKWLYKRDKEGFLVAEVNGKVVGFAAGDSKWINQEGERVLEIHEIFIIPERRGRGIGSKLIEKLLEYGREKGLKMAELWVGEKNLKAIEFYKTLGFKEAGLWGKWLRMIKPLNS